MAKYGKVTTKQIETCIDRLGGWGKFLRFVDGQGRAVFNPLFQLVNHEIKVSAHDHFVVADNFKKGNAGIYSLDDNFQKSFGDKVEENIPAATLSSRKLMQPSVDGPIKAELGDGHETFLCWLFEQIEKQADGCEGELTVDTFTNIFYVGGHVVSASYLSASGLDHYKGWFLRAVKETHPDDCFTGRVVFSRNSVLVPSETLVPA